MPCITKRKLSQIFVKSHYVINRRATPNYYVENKPLSIHNLVFVYGGKGTFTKNGKKINVSCGDVCYFEQGCSRILETDKTDTLKFYTVNFIVADVYFDDESSEYHLKMQSLNFDFVRKITNHHTFQKLVSLFERLINLYLLKGESDFTKREVEHHILELIIDLHNEGDFNYAGKRLADKALKYMQEHLNEKITLNKISEYCKTSPSHLGKLFKEVTGISTIDYLVKMRLKKAKHLLAGGMSVSQTAEECGFCDVYYFSSCFKKNEKISPLQYAKTTNEEIINDRYL